MTLRLTSPTKRIALFAVVMIGAGVGIGITADRVALAQQPAPSIKRTVLQRADDPGSPKYEAVMAMAEIPAGGTSGRHTHPGVELAYVLEGTAVMARDGGKPMTLKAGDVIQNPAGAIHSATNTGTKPVKILAFYIVEKGKPLAEPAK
jgi:quercetin dioxygenase-like cupin family protein